jgi:hypothetical protein
MLVFLSCMLACMHACVHAQYACRYGRRLAWLCITVVVVFCHKSVVFAMRFSTPMGAVQVQLRICSAVGVRAALSASLHAMSADTTHGTHITTAHEHDVQTCCAGASGAGASRRSARASSLPPKGVLDEIDQEEHDSDELVLQQTAWASLRNARYEGETANAGKQHSWAGTKNEGGKWPIDLGHVVEQEIAQGQEKVCRENEEDLQGHETASSAGNTSPCTPITGGRQSCSSVGDADSKELLGSPYKRLFSGTFFRKRQSVDPQVERPPGCGTEDTKGSATVGAQTGGGGGGGQLEILCASEQAVGRSITPKTAMGDADGSVRQANIKTQESFKQRYLQMSSCRVSFPIAFPVSQSRLVCLFL